MKVLFYVNSHYGLGHYKRIYNIAFALSQKYPQIEVTIIYSGVPTNMFNNLSSYKIVNVPGFTYWNACEFRDTKSTQNSKLKNRIFSERRKIISNIIKENKYKVLVTEYFPFSKFEFYNEVKQVLSYFRKVNKKSFAVVSVRDFIHGVEGTRRVLTERIIENCYDFILVHSDPTYVKFERSYGDISSFSDKLVYTGFVVNKAKNITKKVKSKRRNIIISVGGGHDGYPLIKTVLDSIRTANRKRIADYKFNIFLGPFFPKGDFRCVEEMLAKFSGYHMNLKKADAFDESCDGADLSISMCGYNTCYELLSRGIAALFLPRQRKEQMLRADFVARMNLAEKITNSSELVPRLEKDGHIKDNSHVRLNFNGANSSADFIYSLCIR